jgi:hypothetical protein
MLRPAPEPEVQQRRLADYDTVLGLTDLETGMGTGIDTASIGVPAAV